MKKANRKDAVLLSLQIAYEYPDWGWEHISDMFATYKESGDKPPCTPDELHDLATKASRLKRDGMSFEEAEKAMI